MMLFVFFGVVGDGSVLKDRIFASGMDMVSFLQMTPRKSTVVCATLSLLGLILIFPSLSRCRTLESLSRCSDIGPSVANMMSSA